MLGVLALAGATVGACKKTSTQVGDAPFARAVSLRDGDRPGLVVDRITLLGTVELSPSPAPGVQMHELSGLAWDDEAGKLWAVSDRGDLYALLPIFDGDHLVGASFLGQTRLQKDGAPVRGDDKDAEGLVLITRDGRRGLAVSYEKAPRVIFHDFDGRDLKRLNAPGLEDGLRYEESNHALEALGYLPGVGLITAPEASPDNNRPGQIPLWHVERDEPLGVFVGLGIARSSLVALEDVGDGRLLALERAFERKDRRLRTGLYLLKPKPGAERLKVERLALLDTADGWRHDNYEGLTRHRDRFYFMVTDDNGGPPQRTLLTYFSIPAPTAAAPLTDTAPPTAPLTTAPTAPAPAKDP